MNGKTVKENSRLYEQYNGHSTQDRSSKLVVQHLTMVLMQIFFFSTIVVSSQQCNWIKCIVQRVCTGPGSRRKK